MQKNQDPGKCHMILSHFLEWAIPEKAGGLRICSFQGCWKNSKWNFQGLIKKKVEFPVVIKKKSCGISPGVSKVLGLKLSEGCNTIL